MALVKFNSFTTTEPDLGRLISILKNSFQSLAQSEIIDGQIINFNAPTVGGDNIVYHGLNRTPNGFIVIQQNAQATIWWPGQSTTNTIRIRTSAAVNGKAWIF